MNGGKRPTPKAEGGEGGKGTHGTSRSDKRAYTQNSAVHEAQVSRQGRVSLGYLVLCG